MKKRTTQIAIWAIALLLTARLTWTANHHDMPVLDTVTIGIFALYAAKAGAEHLAVIVRRTRNGATR